MESLPNPIHLPSTALVPYDPALPQVSVKAHLEAITDRVFNDAMKIALFETQHLSPAVTPIQDRRLNHVLPILSGPHLVGHSSFVLEVPDDQSTALGSDKQIGIEIFAPTSNALGNKVFMQMRPGSTQQLTDDQIQTLHTHSTEHLDPLENRPILIFSHGFGANPTDYRPLVEEMASHGYVILNLNHPASSNHAPFSKEALSGHAIDKIYNSGDEEKAEEMEERAATGTANIRFVVEQIKNGTLEGLPKNFGITSPIVLAGHSLGGASSVMASRNNPHIAGCIDLDGRLTGKEKKTDGLDVPVLLLRSEPESQDKSELQMAREFDEFKNNSTNPFTSKMLSGVRHNDFSMMPMIDWLKGNANGAQLNAGLIGHSQATQEMLNFMKSIKAE